MARLTVTEAIRQSGVSRSTFYAKYVKKGIISVNESNGSKYVDTSELLRVFGELKGEVKSDSPDRSEYYKVGQKDIDLAVQAEQIKSLREQLADFKEQLSESKEREHKYFEHLKFLEAPKKNSNPFVRWWRGLDKK